MARRMILILTLVMAGCSAPGGSPSLPAFELASFEVGHRYAFSVATHCGVVPVKIDGDWWSWPEAMRLDQDGYRAAFDNPWDEGWITFSDRGTAEYESARHDRWALVRGVDPAYEPAGSCY